MPRKRSNGEGYLHKRSNGTWEWQITLGYDDYGKRLVKSIYGKTQKEVKEKGEAYLAARKDAPAYRGDMTFSEWADIWYNSMRGQVKDSTYDGYKYTLMHLKEYFGEMPLCNIKAITVEKFLREMVDRGESKSYITKFRGMLSQILKKAEANELIKRNVVAVADKIKVPEAVSKKDSFTADEVERMLEKLPYDKMGLSIRLMLGTGMRTQEIMGLMPEHIEPDGSVIHIRQAVTMHKGHPQIGTPKTKTSYRDIPVPESLRPLAIQFRGMGTDYIWCGLTTPICNPSQFRRGFTQALIRVGDVRLLSPHCCRHTYVSQLQALGVEIETIKSLSGHADIDMTEHYLHVQSEVKADAAKKLDKLFVQ